MAHFKNYSTDNVHLFNFLRHITLFINNTHQLQMVISDVCKYINIVKSLEGQNCKSICICTFLKNKTHQSYIKYMN